MREKIDRFFEEAFRIIKGNEWELKLVFASFLSKGHVLLEGVPGIGKTTIALTFSKLLGLEFKRIQGTSDSLPADITGAFVPDFTASSFRFVKGPIFTDILLVDEINRMNPRTQSALLEAMEERQVSIEGKSFKLSPYFFVIATQNPIESYGTYPLPRSQLDRFMTRIEIKRVSTELEMEMVEQEPRDRISTLLPVFQKEELDIISEEVKNIKVHEDIKRYAFELISSVREHPAFYQEVSTRAVIHLFKIAKAIAYLEGRDYTVPDDFKKVFKPVILHRIGINLDYVEKDTLLSEVLKTVKAPF